MPLLKRITAITRLTVLLAAAALSACGGGGDSSGSSATNGSTSSTGSAGSTGSTGSTGTSGSTGSSSGQPTIQASILIFPTAATPPGFLPSGSNTAAAVTITSQGTGSPITTAVVILDGTTLGYVTSDQQYEAFLNVNPGATVTLNVTVNGVTYTASHTNFSTYPTITAPAGHTSWSPQASNLITWSGVVPDSSSNYAVGIFDATNGAVVWPANNSLDVLPGTQNSDLVPANALTAGNRVVLVGIVEVTSLPGAAADSGVLIGAFNYAQVIITAPNASPVSLTDSLATATIFVGKSESLTATATYSDNSTQDVTTRAAWSSSDTSKVTVSNLGVITGVAVGSATVTVQLGNLSWNTVVTVIPQPTPSPLPPLSQSVTYQIDYAHSGRATFGANGPTFPPSAHWATTLNGNSISYPLIAGGKVFVTTNAPPSGQNYGTTLYALDEVTGNVAWGPTPIPGTYAFSGTAYDNDTVFVLNFDGVLSSFNATTGTPGWSVQLHNLGYAISPPTAINGIVYVNTGDGSAAVTEANGNILWTQYGSVHSAPTVSPDGVFLSGPCDAYKLDPLLGTVLWHFAEGCSGGGGKTAAFANNSLYERQLSSPSGGFGNVVLDAASGVQTGTFNAGVIPAFSATASFMLYGGQLTATSLSTKAVLWTFSGDGMLQSAPIVIDNAVVIGSGSGTVYALDAATGAILWSGSAGAAIPAPDEQNATLTTGLGAGEGYLVVPAGSVVNGWRLIP